MPTRAIFIFIKNPILGLAKTRIAKDLGDENALSIYRYLLRYTHRLCVTIQDCERHVFYSHYIDNDELWDESLFHKHLQKGNDLGQRLSHAFLTSMTGGMPTIVIGADCPYLTIDILEQAYGLLQENDTVVGPSSDGGYYLLGMKKPCLALFEGIRWSSASTLEDTLRTIERQGLTHESLPMLSDIDTANDWKDYIDFSPAARIIAKNVG